MRDNAFIVMLSQAKEGKLFNTVYLVETERQEGKSLREKGAVEGRKQDLSESRSSKQKLKRVFVVHHCLSSSHKLIPIKVL